MASYANIFQYVFNISRTMVSNTLPRPINNSVFLSLRDPKHIPSTNVYIPHLQILALFTVSGCLSHLCTLNNSHKPLITKKAS